ncbi:dipeptide/oligopeptide/nickel ABC transporter permease/ATP-binding protein [Arthrobacter sp. MMS18-M83]|uniref:dipeptide/oligopeptide/nickel ABC transporter permease/ATP-binding protein n=1 Tax=Arthrobacter sp. MMS18-M83 TaxID=2996261 RepID=UPI00227C6783|nr:dipeptide/oligopeptide/nickel ABC transporter permease/ATP-binding protein [Arthrobacter sp. MMS18-M83]WAH97296.1 dipeptide/oligopeptide/nickel ABC transporter permease/ATP-binding protein [Arthrobacter sp. MMS18-M83]
MTSPSAQSALSLGTTPRPSTKHAGALRRLLRDPVSVVCLAFLFIVVAASILAPFLTGEDPNRAFLDNALAPASSGHPLGGDGVGRDVLARLLYGGRLTLLGGLIAVTVALLIGIPAGLCAGYFRGWFDTVAGWFTGVVMAVPAIIVLLVVMAVVSQSIYVAMTVLGLILSPGVFWLVRSCATSVREELYVDAAKVSGLRNARIIRCHILPTVFGPTLIQAVGTFSVSVSIQAGLAFLGLGSTSEASWGAMLNDAFPNIYIAPVLLVWPGVAIALTVAALNLIANRLRDILGGDKDVVRGNAASKRRTPTSARARADTSTPCREDTLLSIENLRVTYPTSSGEAVVVSSVSLTVRRGEVLGLVGESGSGKSQTAFSILGLLPQEAQISADGLTFDGTDLLRLAPSELNDLRGARIAYIPQEPMSNLDPSFKIGSQLVEPIRQHLAVSASEAKTRALALLARVGIAEPDRVFDCYPHQISGGMAQRVLIAGAVSCDPDLLIADEPTTALDVTVQAEILDLMRSLQCERGMGMLLVTHDFGVVADICDRVAVMYQGRIVEANKSTELFARPRDPYTQMLLASTLEGQPARTPLSTKARLVSP